MSKASPGVLLLAAAAGIFLVLTIFWSTAKKYLSSPSAEAIQPASGQSSPSQTKKPPNILFILVDDLGWGDVGFHNLDRKPDPEIMTPNLDVLATRNGGLILNRHYVHSSCTGTRTALQSGRLPVHVQTSLKNPEDPSSGMPRNMTGLAEHMKAAGYATHYVGKWDVGMATPKHLPTGRGYDTSLHYFEHKNDYWDQSCMQSICCRPFEKNLVHYDEPVVEKSKFQNLTITDLWDTHQPAYGLNGTDYEELIFLDRMRHIIDAHVRVAAADQHGDDADNNNNNNNNNNKPLFLFYAPHIAHCPLQVPQAYLDRLDFVTDDSKQCAKQTPNILPPSSKKQPRPSCRRQYRAMVNMLDDLVGQIVSQFKEKGLWDNTLMVFTSDNGGPTHLQESGSTNFDLRGGKYSDWEGGVRATAFVAGGYLDTQRHALEEAGVPLFRHPNGIVEQSIHIADWYKTIPAIAGLNELDLSQEEPHFPPVDGLNIWPYLIGKSDTSPRQEIPLSYHSLIQGNFKLIWRDKVPESSWTGPRSPNGSSTQEGLDVVVDCRDGCLFNVAEDRGEHVDLSEQYPIKVQAMQRRLIELRKDFFENNDRGMDSCPVGIDVPCACWMAVNYYGGFFGPWQSIT